MPTFKLRNTEAFMLEVYVYDKLAPPTTPPESYDVAANSVSDSITIEADNDGHGLITWESLADGYDNEPPGSPIQVREGDRVDVKAGPSRPEPSTKSRGR